MCETIAERTASHTAATYATAATLTGIKLTSRNRMYPLCHLCHRGRDFDASVMRMEGTPGQELLPEPLS